jgi:hypothetical protein
MWRTTQDDQAGQYRLASRNDRDFAREIFGTNKLASKPLLLRCKIHVRKTRRGWQGTCCIQSFSRNSSGMSVASSRAPSAPA